MDPLTQHDLETLGSFLLEHLTPKVQQWAGIPCDHTFRLTTAWLHEGKTMLNRGHGVAQRAMSCCITFERRPRCLGGAQRGGGIRCHSSSRTVQRCSVIPAAIAGVRWVPLANSRLI